MIGRREFLSTTFKAIVGGTLILLPVSKVFYSFPTQIVTASNLNTMRYHRIVISADSNGNWVVGEEIGGQVSMERAIITRIDTHKWYTIEARF